MGAGESKSGPIFKSEIWLKKISELNGTMSKRHLDDSFLWRLWGGGWIKMASCCSSWSGLPL